MSERRGGDSVNVTLFGSLITHGAPVSGERRAERRQLYTDQMRDEFTHASVSHTLMKTHFDKTL